MKAQVEVKFIDDDCIEFIGKKYYVERYVEIMMQRAESKGYEEGLKKVTYTVEHEKLEPDMFREK